MPRCSGRPVVSGRVYALVGLHIPILDYRYGRRQRVKGAARRLRRWPPATLDPLPPTARELGIGKSRKNWLRSRSCWASSLALGSALGWWVLVGRPSRVGIGSLAGGSCWAGPCCAGAGGLGGWSGWLAHLRLRRRVGRVGLVLLRWGRRLGPWAGLTHLPWAMLGCDWGYHPIVLGWPPAGGWSLPAVG